MTYCSYEKLLAVLKNKCVKILDDVPNCPKRLDSFCMAFAGNCEQGNRKNCEQYCRIITNNGGLYKFHVMFVYKENTRQGYVVKEDLSIQHIIERNIISESDFVELSI